MLRQAATLSFTLCDPACALRDRQDIALPGELQFAGALQDACADSTVQL